MARESKTSKITPAADRRSNVASDKKTKVMRRPADDSDDTRVSGASPDETLKVDQHIAAERHHGETGKLIGRSKLTGSKSSNVDVPIDETEIDQESSKTRLVGAKDEEIDAVVGWLVVTDGPGRGGFRPIFNGMNSIGRSSDQRVCLDFGDDAISRQEHAFVVYDDEQRKFFIQHGGKANIVRVNKKPVMSPLELKERDEIHIGNSKLCFIQFCGPKFNWGGEPESE